VAQWICQYCAVTILFAILLCACTVGPDFKSPAAPTTSAITEQALPGYTVSTPVAGGESQKFQQGAASPKRWWTLYGSAQLDHLVEQAFSGSPTVTSAQAALRAAQQNLAAQRGALFPSFSGNLNPTRQKISGASEGFPQAGDFLYTLYNTSISLSYTLDLFGGVQRGVEAQQAALDVQRDEMQATYQTLAANVVAAAVLEASLRAQAEATHALLASATRQLDRKREFTST